MLDISLDEGVDVETPTATALDGVTADSLPTADEDCRLLDGVITGKESVAAPTDLEAEGPAAFAEGEKIILLST